MHFAQFLYGDLFFGFLETEIPINLAKIGSKCNLFGFKIYYIIYIYFFFQNRIYSSSPCWQKKRREVELLNMTVHISESGRSLSQIEDLVNRSQLFFFSVDIIKAT